MSTNQNDFFGDFIFEDNFSKQPGGLPEEETPIYNNNDTPPIILNKELSCPHSIKWQKEVDLHRLIDTTIMIEGNVNDAQVYYQNGQIAMGALEDYLYDTLREIGYKTVVFFNHIEGFYCLRKDEQSLKRFKKIIKRAEQQEETKSDVREDADSSLFGEAVKSIRLAMANNEEPVAIILCDVSRYISSPSMISDSDQFFYSKLSLATKKKGQDFNGLHSMVFMIAEKANDIPAWFYLNNPRVKTITVPVPDNNIRQLYIDSFYYDFDYNEDESEDVIKKNKELFVAYTDGFKLLDLESLRILMNREQLGVADVSQGVSKFKHGVDQNPWEDNNLRENLNDLENSLKKRVKGQDGAVSKAAAIIKSAVLGLAGLQHSSSKSKPRGVMFLAGPTGVGKTELAKAIAEWVFKSEEHVIRFDMSEYSQSHTDQRLLGAPPGYVGYEQGGQLTEAVKRQPFSVLLFDEIEKAHPSIMDKFLQILEDGRMTDGKGETVYFSDCLIIFTSNLGMFKETHNQYGMVERVKTVEYGEDGCNDNETTKDDKYKTYSTKILDAINDFFTIKIERPEIKNRIGENFIVFNYVSRKAAVDIASKQVKSIIANLKTQKNIDLQISTDAQKQLANEFFKNEHISQGGRGVGNVIENMLIRPLSDYLVNNKIWEDNSINISGFEFVNGNWRIICND